MRLLLAASAESPNTQSLVRGLSEYGWEVHVATLHPGRVEPATVHSLDREDRRAGRAAYIRAVPRFLGLRRRLRPDLCVGYYASSYGLLATLAPHPRAIFLAGSDVLVAGRGFWSKRVGSRLAALALRRADRVVCWAPHMAEAARRLGADPEKVVVQYRGIDTRLYRPAADVPCSPRRTIVSTRWLEDFYRPHVLLEAFRLLLERGRAVELHFVGGGPALPGLEAEAERAGISANVTFHGECPAERVAELLRRSDVFVSVPPSEGVSASLLEAMCCGLVPVVSDIEGNRSWVTDGEGGLLVGEPVEAPALAVALERALDDAALAERARRNNPPIVEARGSRERGSRRLAELLERLVRDAR